MIYTYYYIKKNNINDKVIQKIPRLSTTIEYQILPTI